MHGITEHVGKSDSYLKSRVRFEASKIIDRGDDFRGLGVGSFTSMESANRLVNSTIADNRDKIVRVVQGDNAYATRESKFSSPTGYEAYLRTYRAEPVMRETYGVRIFILRDRNASKGWRVQSAFPVR